MKAIKAINLISGFIYCFHENRKAIKKNVHLAFLFLFFLFITFSGCSKEEQKMLKDKSYSCPQIALEFTRSLAGRDYEKAYAMTSQEYQKVNSAEQMKKEFESIIPGDWGSIGTIEVGETMTSWPGKVPEDICWAYVSIGGDVYSEAITVVITSENGEEKIRLVEFGRP